jgi:hypothetical protein
MRRGFAVLAVLLLSACASPAPPGQPAVLSRTPTAAEREEAKRALVSPYLACMQVEARRLSDGGVVGPMAIDACDLKCGRLIQELRRYGAAKNYDALTWGEYIGQVERNGRALAVQSAAK